MRSVTLDYPEVPVGAILAGSARRFGNRTAFADGEEALSYAELAVRARRFAAALAAAGIGHGQTVGFHLPNCLAFPVAYFGTMQAGATFSPANPLSPREDLAFQLADCAADAVITDGHGADTLAAVLDRTSAKLAIVVNPGEFTLPDERWVDFGDFLANAPEGVPEPRFDVHRDLAHLAYTGGTTGRSRGVRLSHRNIVAGTIQAVNSTHGARIGLDEHGGLVAEQLDDGTEWPTRLGTGIAITVTPWFHAMGIIGSLNGLLLAGYSVHLPGRFQPDHFLVEAERLRVTMIGGAPALFTALLASQEIERDLDSVRTITFGAAPMPLPMLEALQTRFPNAVICEGYGMTEGTMTSTMSPTNRSGVRKAGSVGPPAADTEIKIVPVSPDEGADPERPLSAGELGEVCVRGPQVMNGYHNRPAETAAALVDGWLHTGDLGVLDEDGYLTIVGRKKEMLLYKGYNVFPRELENALMAHPDVRVAAVVGRPDPAVGDLPVAFVVRSTTDAVTTQDALMAAINEDLVPYKRLRELYFVDSLPVSAAGKILKRELVARLAR